MPGLQSGGGELARAGDVIDHGVGVAVVLDDELVSLDVDSIIRASTSSSQQSEHLRSRSLRLPKSLGWLIPSFGKEEHLGNPHNPTTQKLTYGLDNVFSRTFLCVLELICPSLCRKDTLSMKEPRRI